MHVGMLECDRGGAPHLGSSDPYVKFKYKGNLVYKSEVVTQNLNPRWDEQFEQVVDTRSEPLKVEVRTHCQ